MRSVSIACVTFLLWILSGSTAQAFYPCCPMPYTVAYEMRPVICYRPEWREEKVPCVIQRVSYRQEVKQIPTTIWVPKEFDQKVRTCYYVPVPKVVEREVQRCVMVPMPMFDPCTGCCFVQYCPQWFTHRVSCTEYDYRKEEREVIVRVCRMVPQAAVVEHVCWIPVVTQEHVWTLRHYCVMVPYQTTVCVPVYVPCCP